jgi:hypothetical protein
MATKKPEYVVSNNAYGKMFFGPGGEKDTKTEYNLNTSCGYDEIITNDGNKGNIIPGSHYEHILGNKPIDDRKIKEEGNVTKLIRLENGDLAITCVGGDIRLKAKNVYIEATGEDNNGSFMVFANEAITMSAGEMMTLNGAKMCISSTDWIALHANGFLYQLCADVKSNSPFGSLPTLPGGLKDLLNGIALGCK